MTYDDQEVEVVHVHAGPSHHAAVGNCWTEHGGWACWRVEGQKAPAESPVQNVASGFCF